MRNWMRYRRLLVASCLWLAAPGLTAAATLSFTNLDLSSPPLFITTGVEPNLELLLDDSGNMETEVMPPPNASYASGDTYSKWFEYVLPTANNGLDQGYVADTGTLYPIYEHTIIDQQSNEVATHCSGCGFWRFKSSSFNKLYYDPAKTYTPWIGYPDANPAAAPVDPNNSSLGTIDLTKSVSFYDSMSNNPNSNGLGKGTYKAETTDPAKYYIWANCTGASGPPGPGDSYEVVDITANTIEQEGATSPTPVSNYGTDTYSCTDPTTGVTSTQSAYSRAGRTDCTGGVCTQAEELQNYANWFTYYRKRSYLAKAYLGQLINSSGAANARVGLWTFNGGNRNVPTDMSVSANKTDLLSSLYTSPASCVSTFDGTSVTDPSLNTINNETTWHEFKSTVPSQCALSPTREALANVGAYFMGSNTPILPADQGGTCQQNFDVIVAGSYWTGGDDLNSTYLNSSTPTSYSDLDAAPSGATSFTKYMDALTNTTGNSNAFNSNTLADIALYYYQTDLSTLANDVPTTPNVDSEDIQHLVTFTVSLGMQAAVSPVDYTSSTFTGWPWVAGNDPLTVDDLEHAAINGRGQYFNSADPTGLQSALSAIVRNVGGRSASSSSVALSSGYLQSNTLLFQARFNSTNWTGQVLAYALQSSGAVGTALWDAGCVLTGGYCSTNGATYPGQDWNTGRTILTDTGPTGSYPYGIGEAFRWSGLTAAQQAALDINPDTLATDTLGQDRLNWLRGETITGMRIRDSLLGDTVSSNPVYVGPPHMGYPDSIATPSYSAFATAEATRTPIIYVGANDGMLHGFNATTGSSGGTEVMAFVPSTVYKNLPDLTSTNYGGKVAHRYYVNGSPTQGDVVINGVWKTILVGGLGAGGQEIYALDVTHPSTFSEATPTAGSSNSGVLWDFTDADDPDLGYTFGQPAIMHLHNGQWGVIIGNGYDNTAADAHPSASGDAVIYILNAATGAIISKFDTHAGTQTTGTGSKIGADYPTNGMGYPNGIAEVDPVSLNGDYSADYIYAGDLYGNVWKIDVTSSNPSNWGFAYGTSSAPKPLFVARGPNGNRQPITAGLDVALHPTLGGELVYFGTGRYLTPSDNSATGQNTQTFYAIWDRNVAKNAYALFGRLYLLPQHITSEVIYGAGTSYATPVRLTSANTITWYQGAYSNSTGTYTNSGLPPLTPTVTDASGDTLPAAGELGWYMDLINTNATQNPSQLNYGERVVVNPIMRNGSIMFVTLLPSSAKCSYGGTSYLMYLNAYSGAREASSPFDLNQDGTFTTADTVNGEAASGIQSNMGILTTPGLLNSGQLTGAGSTKVYLTGTGGNKAKALSLRQPVPVTGRQSWRQIK